MGHNHRPLWAALILLAVSLSVTAISFEKNDNLLRYVGRFDMSREYPSADWSGSGITMFVNTTSPNDDEKYNKSQMTVDVSLTANIGTVSGSDMMLYFVGVLVNCELLDIYEISSVNNVIQFSFTASSSSSSVDEIHVIKLTEGSYSDSQGELALSGYTLSANSHLVAQQVVDNVPPTCRNPSDLNLLIIGDSLTAAYGVDGSDPCTYSASTQNFLHSYAYLTAQALGAELMTVAWSGKGVVRNYGDPNPTSVNPLPTYYNRTLAPLPAEKEGEAGLTSENYWDPSRYTPTVVLVMLGSNDYSTTPNPSDEDFTNGLVDFLNIISTDYPSALLAAMCAPSNHGNQCANIENATKMTGSTFVSMNSSLYVSPNGCDGHPSIQTQQNIADVVTPAVRDMLKLRSAE